MPWDFERFWVQVFLLWLFVVVLFLLVLVLVLLLGAVAQGDVYSDIVRRGHAVLRLRRSFWDLAEAMEGESLLGEAWTGHGGQPVGL